MDLGRFPTVHFEKLNDELVGLYLAAPSAPKQGVEPLGYISKNVAEYLATKGPVTTPILLEKEFSDDVALYLAAPSAPVLEWPVLDKPALVGGGRFHVGVSARLVVEAAQRHYEYEVTPEKEAERVARASKAIDALVAPVQAVPDWQPIETAPKDGAWALVYAYGAINCAFVKQDSIPDDWTQPSAPNVIPERVTHWMPLPQPPKEIGE